MLLQVLLYVAGGLLLLVALAFVACTGYIAYVYWKHSHLPSPKRPSFFLGHYPDIARVKKEIGNPTAPLNEVIFRWSLDVKQPLFVVFIIGMPWIITTDADHVKELSMNPYNDKPRMFWKNFHSLFGERFSLKSLVSILDYETWQPRRKVYDPCFKKSYLKGLIPGFNKCVDKFLQKLDPLADGKTRVPLVARFSEVSLDVLSKIAFGTDFSAKYTAESLGMTVPEGTNVFNHILCNSVNGLNRCMTRPSPTLHKWLYPKEVQGYKQSVRAMRKIGRECIEERIAALKRGDEAPHDIISQMLQVAATNHNEDDIEVFVDDFVTFYIGGQESSASLLGFATAHVHLNPHILERLVAEVDEVLGDKDTVSAEDIEKLQYTEQVLLEALRKHPVVSPVFKCSRNGGYVGEYYLPAGTAVFLSSKIMCRMPEYFDEPEVFNPGRFDPENKRPSPFVFFPFGTGHRSCIGSQFAMIETKIILARLLQRYKITLPPDYKVVETQTALAGLQGDLPCTLERRKE